MPPATVEVDFDAAFAELVRHQVGELPRWEWLDLRRQGIGGSDAGAIFGVDPYKSSLDVWLEKTERQADRDLGDVEAVQWGHLLEGVITEEWGRRVELPVWKPDIMLWHPDRPWMRANVDRLYMTGAGELGVLEAKNVGHYSAINWDEPDDIDDVGIPAAYELQVLHYLAVTGVPKATIVALLGGKKLIWREVVRDDELIQDLIDVEQAFWEDHVLADRPPPVDGSEAATEALSKLWRPEPDKVIELGVEAVELIERYWQAHREMKKYETLKNHAANELRMLMGDAEYARFQGRDIATWKGGERRQFQQEGHKVHLDLLHALGFREAAEWQERMWWTVEPTRTLRPKQKITRKDFPDG